MLNLFINTASSPCLSLVIRSTFQVAVSPIGVTPKERGVPDSSQGQKMSPGPNPALFSSGKVKVSLYYIVRGF